MAMDDWPIKRYSVASLYLDALNPRLTSRDSTINQREIVHELIANYDLLGLSKSIAESGYLQGELVLATKEGGRLVILEGNRRVAALKLLRNPGLAPDENRVAAQRLAKIAMLKSDPKLPVMIAPDRDKALLYLSERHTGAATKPWTLANQARFIAEQRHPSEGLEAFVSRTRLKKAEVKKLLYTDEVYRLALTLDLDDCYREQLVAPSFPLSTLMRILEASKGREWLGIERTENGEINFKVPYDQFELALSRIVMDLCTAPGDKRPRTDSRSLNSESALRTYFDGISDSRPKGGGGRRTSSKKVLAKKAAKKKTNSRAPKVITKKAASLLPASVKCGYSDGRVADVYIEIKKLRLEATPNASAIVFRTLLDLAMSRYLEDSELLGDCIAGIKRANPKRNYSKDFHPSLREMLKYFCSQDSSLSPQGRKAVTRLLNREHKTFTLDDLNDLVHDGYCLPTKEHLRNLASSLEPLLSLILQPVSEAEELQ